MSKDNDEIIDLGSDFEVIEDSAPKAEDSKKSKTSAPSKSPQTAKAPISSTLAWQGFGLAIALGGLLGPWGEPSMAGILQGLALAAAVWQLLTHGIAGTSPTVSSGKPIAPALVALAGGAGLALSSGELGPILTLVGGLLALAAPKLGAKKDAKMPLPPARDLDPQFMQSLAVYLAAFVGIMMPWGSGGERGVDSIFGVITLLCVLMSVWGAWVGSWKMWTLPVVTGKLGILLFLAPVEILLLGLFGVIRFAADTSSGIGAMTLGAWPQALAETDSGELVSGESLLVDGAGALLTFFAGVMALVVLVKSAKTAMAMAKDKKTAEIQARKEARAARKK